MELEISPRVSILLLSDGSKSVSTTCAVSWNEFISTCWGCWLSEFLRWNGSASTSPLEKVSCIPLHLSTRCVKFVSGHRIFLTTLLLFALLALNSHSCFLQNGDSCWYPRLCFPFFLPPPHVFSPCICWLLWLWHEFLVSTQEQALLVSVFSWIKYRQVTSDVIMIALHSLQHWAQIRTGMHSCVFNIFCWPVEAGDGEGYGYMTKLLFQNRMVKQDPDKCQTFLYQACQA